MRAFGLVRKRCLCLRAMPSGATVCLPSVLFVVIVYLVF